MIHAKAAAEALKKLETSMISAVRQALGQSAALAAQLARTSNRFKDRSGALRASIQRVSKSDWHQQVRAGGPGARHALFVEGGTVPHAIVPRRRQFLRFEQGGRIRFAKRVWHPGTKAARFMQTARDAGEVSMAVFVQNGLRRVFE